MKKRTLKVMQRLVEENFEIKTEISLLRQSIQKLTKLLEPGTKGDAEEQQSSSSLPHSDGDSPDARQDTTRYFYSRGRPG